jgi:peptide chain release factor 3
VTTFMDIFQEYAPPPVARTSGDEEIDPKNKTFTGFVFKVQANMDKRHRDRVAFLRVCSGKFERGMKVQHMRLNKEVRLAYANQFMADERTTVDTAYAGDIVGINDTGNFRVGDSVSTGKKVEFTTIPRFCPEIFGRIKLIDVSKRKHLEKALTQFSEEGSIQIFIEPHIGRQDPVIGVVGQLQFEVMMFRLKEEYNLEAKLLSVPYAVARWPRTKDNQPYTADIKGSMLKAQDGYGEQVVLLEKEWDLNWATKENPDVVFATSIQPTR